MAVCSSAGFASSAASGPRAGGCGERSPTRPASTRRRASRSTASPTCTRPDGTRLFRGRARVGPVTVTWDDRPCNWVRDGWFEHTRLFENGPLTRLTARLELTPEGDGCTGAYELQVEARNLLGRTVVGPALLAKGARTFERLAAEAEAFALGEREAPFDPPPPDLPAGVPQRAERIGAELAAAGHDQALVERLLRLVLAGGEQDVARIRPLALARAWGAPPEAAIALCLEATRRGLLGLSWDLLCPRCRGAKVRAPALDQLPRGAHCRHLQHRLRPRVLAQRRGHLPPGGGDPAAGGGRVLPARADEHAAHPGPPHARARRAAGPAARPAARPLPPADARARSRAGDSTTRAARCRRCATTATSLTAEGGGPESSSSTPRPCRAPSSSRSGPGSRTRSRPTG